MSKKIGYIVSNTKIIEDNNLICVKYSEYDKEIHKPCIFIGLKELRENFNFDIDVLDRHIDTDRHWTLSVNENRNIFDDDIYEFTKKCYQDIINKFKYYSLDPFLMGKTKFINKIKEFDKKNDITTVETSKTLFLCSENIIVGINKDTIDYFGINISEEIKIQPPIDYKSINEIKYFNEIYNKNEVSGVALIIFFNS